MKKIIFVFLIFFAVFLIYYFNINKNMYYLSLGDYLAYGLNNNNKLENSYFKNLKEHYKDSLDKYINYSSKEDYRVMDLINDINYNKERKINNKEYKLQNLLIKANYITLSIGMNDIINKENISYEYIDQLLKDIEKLFILIRKYNKDRIDYLSFYNIINNKEIIEYTNKRLDDLCKKNNINFIDITNLNYYIIDRYPNNSGYTYITNQILNFTK